MPDLKVSPENISIVPRRTPECLQTNAWSAQPQEYPRRISGSAQPQECSTPEYFQRIPSVPSNARKSMLCCWTSVGRSQYKIEGSVGFK